MTASRGRRIAAAAATIAALTVVARLAGFLRTLVFAGVVGSTDLGAVYQTANTVPNIIFEIVAGGAMSVIVVPLLAASVAAGDRDQIGEISSALLGWTVVLLVPLAGLLALFATPVVSLLGAGSVGGVAVGGGGGGASGGVDVDAIRVGADMLRVFAIQLPLYGVGIVLTGVLFAHHRFVWPVLAPLLSSLTVIAVYVMFAAVDGPDTTIATVSRTGELILSVGTTLGVAVLTLCLLIPFRSLHVRLRPRLRLSADLRRRAVGLASAAVVIVMAQQLATAYLIRLANEGSIGTVVLYGLAQTVFLLPWAVLAVPLSTPTFPVLARAVAAGDLEGFDATLARTTRAVVLAAGLGIGVLIGTALPAGRLLAAVTKSHPPAGVLSASIVAFAPGLLGFSLFALMNRALSALGQARHAAVAAVAGWSATILAAAVLAVLAPTSERVVALAGANAVGMSVLGAVVLWLVLRRRGGRAVSGFTRTLLVSAVAAAGAAGLGWCVSWATMTLTPSVGGAVVAGMLAGVAAGSAYLGVAIMADRAEVRPAVLALTRRLREGWRR